LSEENIGSTFFVDILSVFTAAENMKKILIKFFNIWPILKIHFTGPVNFSSETGFHKMVSLKCRFTTPGSTVMSFMSLIATSWDDSVFERTVEAVVAGTTGSGAEKRRTDFLMVLGRAGGGQVKSFQNCTSDRA
jgi:hypothetical protein